MLYFYSLVLGHAVRQAGPHAMVGLDDFPHMPSQTYDHSAIVLLFRERVVGSFTWLWGDLVIPMAPCQWNNPPPPGEERPLQHL